MVTKANAESIEKAVALRRNLRDVKSTIPTLFKNQFNFKGRKSPIIGQIIIETLTEKDGIVVDPFMGSGSYLISASNSKRTFYGNELDNYTFDIVNTYFRRADIQQLDKLFNMVKKRCFERIRYLYETKCCGVTNYIKKLHFDPETNNYYNPKPHRDIKDGKNIVLLYKCPICGNIRKKFEKIDEDKINSIQNYDTDDFPSHTLIENSRINITASTGANKYDTNFTKRNKIALLMLQYAINQLPKCHERNLLQHFLVASLTLSRTAQYGSGSEYIYQVMREKAQEMNVWYLFEEKYKKYKQFYKKYIKENVKWLEENCYLSEGDYKLFFENNFKNQKADLILTDPPYYDQVPYLERNQLYRDWLRKFVDSNKYTLTEDMLKKEIVVSDSPRRKQSKNFESYLNDIDNMFYSFNNALKIGGFVVLAVNLGQKKYFDLLSHYIIKARKNGFEYITRIDKSITDPTLRKQAAYKNTLSKEMYLIFTKLPPEKKYWFINNKNMEYEIRTFVYNKIQKLSEPPTLSKMILDVENELIGFRSRTNSSQQFKIASIIKESFKVDQFKQRVYLDENKLYLDLEDSETLFVKLYDLIPMIVNNLLEKQNGIFTLEDVYYEISDKLCNGEPSLLEKILDSKTKEKDIINLLLNYCDETDKGYIRKKVLQNFDREGKIDLRQIDPYEFEELLKDLLVKEGYKNVTRMGGAGDRGVDLIGEIIDKNGKINKVIFQVKRWIGNVGSEPIQRLNSVKMTDGYDHGVCITTSDFTAAGKYEAKLTKIQIVNGKELVHKLNKHYPGIYYISEIKDKQRTITMDVNLKKP